MVQFKRHEASGHALWLSMHRLMAVVGISLHESDAVKWHLRLCSRAVNLLKLLTACACSTSQTTAHTLNSMHWECCAGSTRHTHRC